MTNDKSFSFGVGKQKVLETFIPHIKYRIILVLQNLFIVLGVTLTAFACLIALPIDEQISCFIYSFIHLGVFLLLGIISVIFSVLYYTTIDYSLTTQEIIVNRGLLNKKTKIVPYRNITNFIMRRGLLNRIVGGNNFGAILVETAGQSGDTKRSEQRIVGIDGVAEYTEKIRGILTKMKGQTGLSSDTETASSLDEEIVLKQILETLKEIEKKI